MNVLTLERIDIEALVLPGERRVLEAPFEEAALRVVWGDNPVALPLGVELPRDHYHRIGLSGVLRACL